MKWSQMCDDAIKSLMNRICEDSMVALTDSKISDIFKKVDTDNDGYISKMELIKAIKFMPDVAEVLNFRFYKKNV